MAYEVSGFAVTGNFTEGEWQLVLGTIREIEQTRPDAPFNIVVYTDADATMDDAEAFLRTTFPQSPNPDVSLVVERIAIPPVPPVAPPTASEIALVELRSELAAFAYDASRELRDFILRSHGLTPDERADLQTLSDAAVTLATLLLRRQA